MRHPLSFLALLLLSLCLGCTDDDGDGGEDPAPDPELPQVIPNSWFLGIEGNVENRKEYLSGALEGEECTENFLVTGANITDVIPEGCPSCDLSYTVFLSLDEDCPGGDDIEEEGSLSFDLRQEAGEVSVWWFFEGWWSSEWYELGTGTLVRDDEGLSFDLQIQWDDPDNGDWAGNYTDEEPCAFGEWCTWDGFYTLNILLPFEWVE